MFKEMKSRRLALLVAIALGGGGFLSSAQNVSAADVVIDDAHPTVAADHKVGTDGAAGGVVTDSSGTADVAGNTLTLTKRGFGGRLFGGYTAGSGNVTGNKVFIHNEPAHVVQEKVYGGHANGSGNATGNAVTLTGGTFSDNIYGGSSVGGNATGNTLNLGDGTKTFTGTIHGTIYGGDGPGAGDHVTGNVLNVNTNVIADNIKNFATINFNYNSTVNDGTMLHLNDDSNKRTSVDWNGIHLTGTPNKTLTLMSNSNGIDISNYGGGGSHLTLTDTYEGYVAPNLQIGSNRYQAINYEYNQFAGIRKTVSSSDGTPRISEVDVYGGVSAIGNTTTDNEVTIAAAPGHGKVYGGYTEGDGTTADVAKRYDSKSNKVTITGGAASELYGGYTSSTVGAATGNTVTVKGGTVRRLIYGGFAEHGDATGNTVNLGDAETGAVGNVAGSKIFGGRSRDNTKDQTTGNTLNVNARTTAYNIENFAKINFNFKHVTGNTTLLTLTGTEQTKIKDLGMLDVQNVPRGEGALLENTHGIVVGTYNGAVSKTYEKTETIIDWNGTTNINYKGYQFKGARDSRTVGNATWGGRSVIGNTTTDNIVTLTGNYAGQNVYGGWTSGTGSTATGADAKNHSIGNKITFDNAAGFVENMVGGVTTSEGGNATGNHAVLKNGTVYQSVTGGSVGSTGGNTMRNIVNIDGGTVHQSVYGGYVRSAGKAEENTVTLTNGTVNGAVFGGVTTSGEAINNKVYIKGGSATNVDVHGGFSTNGNVTKNKVFIEGGTKQDVFGGITINGKATGNIVTVTGGSVRNVVGGEVRTTGEASGNIVTVGNVTVNSITGGAGTTTNDNTVNLNGATVNGAVTGGTQASGEGNTLNVKGMNTAQSVEGFQTMRFDTTDVAAGSTMLNVTGAAQTKVNWNTLSASGVAIQKVTLLKNTAGYIHLEGYSGSAKSEITGGNTESNIDVVKDSSNYITDITYQGYQFKDVKTATFDGGNLYGGISKAGNSTRENTITVNSGSHTNVYGGWTSGTGTSAADKGNSHDNTVTVKGTATVSGTVYGGLTESADGKATGNTITVEKSLDADLVGGKAAAEASDNTVNVTNVAVKSVTGGDGATTNNNIVNISGGSRVTNNLAGGTAANSTGNTLNVKGKDNKAGAIANIQKMNFDASGLAKNDTMLEVTGTAQTDVNWENLSATGTAMKPLTLLKNTNGINLTGYTGAAKSVTTETTETNVDVRKTGGTITEITYEGYQFKGVTMATSEGGNLYGGISKAGNSTRENTITVNSGTHTNVYGGWTSGAGSTATDKDNSHDNTVTIAGGTVTGKVYGGYTEASDGKTYNNTVNLNGGNLSHAEISGGNRTIGTEKGNTLNVNTAATVKKIDNFQTVAFKDKDAKLTLKATDAAFDLAAVKADFAATATATTLVESDHAMTLAGGKTFRSDLDTEGTKETNIEVSADKKRITRYGYTLKNATTATTVGSDTWGGRSAAGNTTTGNALTLTAGAHTNVYGGWTSGTGTSAADKGNSHDNTVIVKESATVSGTVYGGYTDVMGGKATDNTVTVEKTINADIIGGKAAAEASGNTVNVTNAAVKSITGGFGTVTNDNRINLRDAKVTGMVMGGTAVNGTGNALNVFYGTKTTEIGDYKGIRNLHFDMEKAPMDGTAHTMLRLTNVGGAKSLSHTHIDLHRDGAAPKLQQGDKITLMENVGGDITVGENLTAKGTDGVTRNYEFALATVGKTLIATVTKTGLSEQAKSFVETRAGASAFLNDGGDYLAGSGMEAAKKEAHAAAQAGSGAYGLWAGMGGGALRHETGSYVDMKGWNLGLGWARENAVQAGTLTFGPFVEYGRGSYDSYLDDGTHGSGKTSFFGAGMMAKLETGSHWIDGSLRVGRTKSDYTGLDTGYDTTSTYYAMHVGVGKDFHVREGDTVSAYVRYSYAHTAGTSAHLSSGETLDFDAVNSHRLRIGTRYTHGATTLSQFYAGLAWEYEFDGDARATSQGDSAPSPSLKGSSALLELGYRFAPKADSRMSYDLNLTGWQGKRQGITGGLSVKWAF